MNLLIVGIATLIALIVIAALIITIVMLTRPKAGPRFDGTTFFVLNDPTLADSSGQIDSRPRYNSTLRPAQQITYTMVLNINNFSVGNQPRVLFARGSAESDATTGEIKAPESDIIVYLDPAYNNVLVAFKTPKTPNNPTSDTYFTDNYCIFTVDNIPLYRWTVFHIVYDASAQNARFYIDGRLRKVFNLFSCGTNAVGHTKNHYSWGKMMASNNTYAGTSFSAPAAPGVIARYSLIAMSEKNMTPGQVEADAALRLRNVNTQQSNVNRSQLLEAQTCPAQ